MPNFTPQPRDETIQKDHTLKVSELMMENPRSWNTILLQALFNQDSVNEILKISLAQYNYQNVDDKPIWIHHSSGQFSVKSAYAAITSNSDTTINSIPSNTWKNLWKLKVQDRLKYLCWKILSNIIQTKELLKNFFPIDSDDCICPICQTGIESQEHLFLNCSFTRMLWRQSPWPLNISSLAETMNHWIECILSPNKILGIFSNEEHSFQIFALVAMDSIWFLRNKVVHDAITPDLEMFISQTLKIHKEHCEAWDNVMINNSHNWKAIPKDHHILTFDVAVRENGSTAAAICRKDEGDIDFIQTSFIHSTNPNQGEATALLIGLKAAKEANIQNLIIAGDSLNTIMAANAESHNPDWITQPIMQDIRHMLGTLNSWQLRKIHRDQNRCAHSVAQWAASKLIFGSIPLIFVPPCLLNFHSGKDPLVCLY
ncbi:uncharacterized protein LOC122301822 [Carya illinoinensis]|uniref:uncharacterized protein LOC122301822 n=1 Tax=Carya illinoinensis TaxID=32201 RepID=UPI001C71DB0B|nr:uncharacterized protein LOC122301822 [Carya illinoinensis]